jgi:hypothetical protein
VSAWDIALTAPSVTWRLSYLLTGHAGRGRPVPPPFAQAEGLPVRHRRPTKSPYFAHGELTKRIYGAMRTSSTVSSFEIAADAMRDKGLDPENDKPTRTDFVRRVSLALPPSPRGA